MDIDIESTNSLDDTVALGGPELEGHPKGPVNNNQNKLMALMREINDIHQSVEAGEGQPAESLDHIECKLQNFSIALHLQPPSTPTEPLREVIPKHKHLVHHTKTNKPNQLITAGHSCF